MAGGGLADAERVDRDDAVEAEELLGEMLDLHAAGVARLWGALQEVARERLLADRAVSEMLLVHGLHPVPLADRVAVALERVAPYLASHGGGVELLDLDDGVARLLLKGSCKGCASSAATLELAIERALEEEAPDLLGVEVEGMPGATRTPEKLLPLASPWHELEATPEPGGLIADASGIVVANVAGTLLAYRDACAGCGASLLGGTLEDGTLECPACARRFSLPLAGRSLGPDGLQLDPVPLLERDGRYRVAA
jgi:Fe-S cluster biogenesis protein NfuA